MPVYPAPQPAPSQRTWAAGEYPTAAQFNTYFRDGIGFLQNPPHVSVRRDAADTSASGTAKAITWDVEEEDTDNMWASTPNPTRITFNTAGVYIVTYDLGITNNATGWRSIDLLLSGVILVGVENRPAVNGDHTFLSLTRQMKVTAGAYVEGRYTQNSGGALGPVAPGGHRWNNLSATWIGVG